MYLIVPTFDAPPHLTHSEDDALCFVEGDYQVFDLGTQEEVTPEGRRPIETY
jgi:hypothetical protein